MTLGRPSDSSSEPTDADLLAAHLAGDPHAFGELFRRHRDRMWGVALRICRDPELAADSVQDGFLAAFRRADSFRGEAAVTTWLHRIVVNACLDRLRKHAPLRPLPDTDVSDGSHPQSSTETALDLRAALARLPEGQRTALVLVDMYAVPVAEAAAILDVAPGTVKSRCARGRTALAHALGLSERPDRGRAGPDGNRMPATHVP